ncbi:MAG: MarR family transcriptional regulator [Novosphingobium sp.]|nr:MarR family transcriptional regulator [Novosphingobium sp.]
MPDPLSQLPGYALRRAANAMMGELADRLAPLGLRVAEASVLMLAGARDNQTSSEIGRILDVQRANMVPLLNRLERAGLVERVPIDRKSSAIVLTLAGRQKLREVEAVTSAFEADLLARVPLDHRDHLVPALNALWR